MDIETIRNICKNLPLVTEDIKWGDDLCFMVGGKMFCVAVLNTPLKVSFKVSDEEFGELTSIKGIIPAPYAARHKWILVEEVNLFDKEKWENYISQSYNLVKSKLSKKQFGGE
ncbi:MAG: MmcQ/YjbR family DNA-binding protein [Sphingobacteriales bacterium]